MNCIICHTKGMSGLAIFIINGMSVCDLEEHVKAATYSRDTLSAVKRVQNHPVTSS